ncbi:MAG: DUF4911 domain-containing protein [Thermodesulfobacteriota bacterium]|nr:DUF4911 domain-containing protein [Thermodesulfobacteriota bacterium]
MCMDKMGTMEFGLHRRDISYLKFILEGYDGLGILSTMDAQSTRAILSYPMSQETSALWFVDALKKEGIIKEVTIHEHC